MEKNESSYFYHLECILQFFFHDDSSNLFNQYIFLKHSHVDSCLLKLLKKGHFFNSLFCLFYDGVTTVFF